ncbi:MAG: DNA translocase FtsK 4TM domain-containing protein [Acidimicrobiales bacterium]
MVVQARHKKKPVKKTATRAGAASDTPTLWQRHERDIWIVVMAVLGLFALLAEAGALGPVGRQISRALALVFGVGRFVLPLALLVLSVALVWGKIEVERARLGWGVALGMISVCGLGDLAGGHPHLDGGVKALAHAGGWIGVLIGGGLHRSVGLGGALTILLAVLVVALIITTGIGLRALASAAGTVLRAIASRFASWWTARPRHEDVGDADEVDEEEFETTEEEEYEEEPEPFEYEEEFEQEEEYEEDVPPPARPPSRARQVPLMSGQWELPPLTMLVRTKDQRQDRSAIVEAGAQLVEALAAHGVDTTLVGYTVGPTVTRFELELGPGVKVSSVTSLNKDIAYAMASPDVRILAPIPGRSAIGVEVPNRQRTLVALGDLLASDEAVAAEHPLDVPIGRDIAGKTVVMNLGEMPHILISGATGAGKSSCINSIVTSLVMRSTPDEVRLVLVDPKRVEMGQYNDLPHLIAPVVVDPKKAAGMLAWAVKEMERRYDLLAESGARDITSYQQMIDSGELVPEASDHELVAEAFERATGLASDVDELPGPEELPYIVIVVDELNDLRMVAARDVEESVVRIAQMARAVGIHLVLATQRPSVDVITGVIKANVPSRMAFAVSSLADSRVILDQAGAERLIGKGDMLLVTASSNIARRLQSPWVSEEEVRRVVEFWRAQGGRQESVVALDIPAGRMEGSASGDDDEVLRQARDLVLLTQQGSTSMLQRKLRVGFARAGRIMDQLEEEGIVAAGDGSKARRVLMTREEYDQQSSY